jgi:hypothetical protein
MLIKQDAKLDTSGEESMALLRSALLSAHPSMEIVRLLFMHGLAIPVPGEKRDRFEELVSIPFEFDSPEVKAIVRSLLESKASSARKIYWAGQILCGYGLSGFTVADELAPRAWARTMKPLWNSMPEQPLSIARAIHSALLHVLSYPDPAPKFSFLMRAVYNLDIDADTEAVVQAVLNTEHLGLLTMFKSSRLSFLEHVDPLAFLRQDKLGEFLISLRLRAPSMNKGMKMTWLDHAVEEQNTVAVALLATTLKYTPEELKTCAARVRASTPARCAAAAHPGRAGRQLFRVDRCRNGALEAPEREQLMPGMRAV